MHAICARTGELSLVELPDPSPAAGEVQITVAAAGVNRADLLQRTGHYPPPPGASDILGLEVSGIITALGPGVPDWQVGDEVCALLAGGGYATQVTVPAGQLLPVPRGVDLISASALPEVACTAWSNLVEVARLRAGESVLVVGGSGGIGSHAIQLAAALGARVVTTAGGPERVQRCLDLGADVALDHRALAGRELACAVKEASGGGVDVILDVLGAGSLATHLASLATGGRLVVIGMQQGRHGEIDLGRLLAKRASIHGTTLRSRSAQDKAEIVAAVQSHVWPLIEQEQVRPVVHAVLPLRDAGRAHELLDSGAVFGKVLLQV
ncbi:NAD(P)H-quinone oxidoreductase [Bogoriella caseilytica]|nr:NAD(P)H-quinone oxidoreductase [Bogoriella caseilytica]